MKQDVTYKHFYDRYDWGDLGGFTICVDWKRKVIGVAICSVKDQYCKKTGRELAKRRSDEQHGDGSIVIVTMPEAHSRGAASLQNRAKFEVLRLINRNFPNKEFGFTFEE